MTYRQEAMRYHPLAFFKMDGPSPFQDYSAFNRASLVSGGTPNRHPALFKGAAYSVVLTSAITASFASPVFIQGKEINMFSIAATIFSVGTAAEQQILGHAGAYDGLTIQGTKISFVTKYLTTGESRATYDLQVAENVNVVGVHTASKNSLYVNGLLVAESDISIAQQADSYVATDGNLYSGTTTGTGKLAIGGVAVYGQALAADAVYRMHVAARDVPTGEEVAFMYGGEYVPVSREASSIFLDYTWSNSSDWYMADLKGVAVNNDRLVPQFQVDTSIAGIWQDSLPLGVGLTSIYGISLDWDGEGAVVEASVDASTWVTATRGMNLSNVPAGFNPTDKDLYIRVSFPGGILNDTSFLDNLNVTGVLSGTTPTLAGRPQVLVGAYQQRDYPVIQMNDNWGTEITSGGTLTIKSDPNAQNNPMTVEFWARSSTPALSINITGTTYQDGVALATAAPDGEWTLYHIVTAAPITTDIVITGPAQVGQVILYPNAMTAADVAAVTSAYANNNSLKVGDNSVVAIAQPGNAAQIYAHDWTIIGAG